MQYILSISIGLNFLLIIFTIRVLKDNFVNIFLLALLSIVLIGTVYVISLNYFRPPFPLLAHCINSLPALVGGLTYLYVVYSINSVKKIRFDILIHLIPFLIAIKLSYYELDVITVNSIILNIGLKIIVSIVYFIISLKLLKAHKTIILNHFSKTESIDLKWLSFIVIVGLISYLIYLFIMIFWAMNIKMLADFDVYANFIALLFIFSISYYSLSSTKVFEKISTFNAGINLPIETQHIDKSSAVNKKELINEEEASLILQKITMLIEEKKLYKNENLMLEDLAKELHLHSKYLSFVINTLSGKNFFDFINHFRIKEFNREVLNPKNKNLTLLTIAFNCGFGSKSAFNRAYKSEMKISPTEFIKNQHSRPIA